MCELRKRCEELAGMIMDATERYGNSDLLQKNAVVELEAFAKEQQIKGMEAVHRDLVRAALAHAHTSGQAALGAVANKLLNEIAKLKEGG